MKEYWPLNFELIVLDIWGVLSDGQQLFDDAIPFLQFLRNCQVKSVLISNTPFRSHHLKEKLARMGLSEGYYDAMITAGDVARAQLFVQSPGKGNAYYYIGPEETAGLLEDLNYKRVDDLQAANFLLITGYPDNIPSLEAVRGVFEVALERKLPVLCPNPDQSFWTKDKVLVFCAGKIARQYELLGGEVLYIGKPFPPIYSYALGHFSHISKEKVLVIGDSLETDIAGAKRMGFKSLLISETVVGAENLIAPNWQAASLKECIETYDILRAT